MLTRYIYCSVFVLCLGPKCSVCVCSVFCYCLFVVVFLLVCLCFAFVCLSACLSLSLSAIKPTVSNALFYSLSTGLTGYAIGLFWCSVMALMSWDSGDSSVVRAPVAEPVPSTT